ncbi:MAG: hypothetical protein V2I43_17410 [Parvularcula sp.]|jgi:hypothetical protein|nr:hypothetical protein [Parvularcula sp.]
MKFTHSHEPSLDELAATTVRLGRELEAMAHAVYLGGNSKDFGFVSRTLRRLAERNPFDPRDEQSMGALRGILDADLASEITGVERQFFEIRYDELGQHGEIRECPVYSDRGREILAILETFNAFVLARDATLDRVAAERALRELLAT